ncbi:4-guanidinobutyraldehyde dehydrogenase/NAD-dependent aldehyde dehydrogenase [Marinobacterium sp. MBR-111]
MTNRTRSDWQAFADSLSIEGRAFIGGQCVDALSGAVTDNVNPATGAVTVQVASCDERDVDLAVASAREAFEKGEWRKLAPAKRKAVLLRWADLIEQHWEELAMLESLDTGKPIACTMDDDGGDVHSSIRTLRWTAECIDKLYGETTPHEQDTLGIVSREPVGVVAAIMPWNYPLATTMWKLAPALGAGNSVVLKPASLTPLTAIKIALLADKAGLPAGVLNVITGPGARLGKALGLHMDVDCIGFTGSTPIGKELLKYSGESNLKLIFNELGGKSANIIFADANLDKAIPSSAAAIFFNSGQTCSAGSRLLVHEDVHDEVVRRLTEVAESTWQPGHPMDPNTLMGPMISTSQLKTVQSYVDLAQEEGARVVCGGSSVSIDGCDLYYKPTILCDVRNDMRVAQEEIFGPVLCVIKFKTAEEAIALANDCIYGLSGAVWTENLRTAHKVATEMRTGNVNVNAYFGADNQISMPFGGFRQTGNGRDKSIHAFDEYTVLKGIWFDFRQA